MLWKNILDFFQNISQSSQQLNRTVNALETQKELENTEININTKGKTFDVKMKNVPKGLFAGQRNLFPDNLANMYNLQMPEGQKVTGYERAKLLAESSLTPPEKPSSSIIAMLKRIPLGGYKFDPRLGWGNVINALSSFAIGQEMVKQDYEEKRRRYELDRENLTRQIMDREISLDEYLKKQKDLQFKRNVLEKENELINKPVYLNELYEGIYDTEFLKKMNEISKSLGLGEGEGENYHLKRMEYNEFLQNIKQMGGLDELYRAFVRNKINSTEGEDKKYWQNIEEQFEKAKTSPNIIAQMEGWRQLKNLEHQNKMNLLRFQQDIKMELEKARQNMENVAGKEKINYTLANKMYSNFSRLVTNLKNQIFQMEEAGVEEELIQPFRRDLELYQKELEFYEKIIKSAFKETEKPEDSDKKIKGIIDNTIRLYFQGKINKEKAEEMIKKAINTYNYQDKMDIINIYTSEAVSKYGTGI